MRKKVLRFEDLKIALVHDWLTVPAGSEAVFEEICSLFPGTVYTSQVDVEKNKFLRDLDVRASIIQKLPGALERHYIYAPLLPYVYSQLDMSPYDLVISDSHTAAHGVRRRADALHINYYHTPARWLWTPEIDPRATKTFVHRAIAKQLRKMDLEASKRPDVLFANSQTTADRVKKYYGRKVDAVIYPPVHTSRWLDVEKIDESEGLLYWGRLIGYKRVDIAIEAVRQTGQRLHIVGSGPAEEKLKAQAEGMRNVFFWGRETNERLKEHLAHAKAVVFPGYEDFGIVPVEAMAAGVPVVAFGSGGVTESVRDQDGVLFDEQTPESMVDALQKLNKKSFDPASLKARAIEFDVDVFRRKFRDAVMEAVQERILRNSA